MVPNRQTTLFIFCRFDVENVTWASIKKLIEFNNVYKKTTFVTLQTLYLLMALRRCFNDLMSIIKYWLPYKFPR